MIEIELPPIVSDAILRSWGLILISGFRKSGRTTTTQSLLNKLNRDRVARVGVRALENEYTLSSQRSHFVSVGNDSTGVAKNHDVIVIDPMVNLIEAIELAESGLLVVGVTYGLSTANVIERGLQHLSTDLRARTLNRLSQVLHLSMNQRLVRGLEGVSLPAFEIVLGVPQIKTAIANDHLSNLDQIVLQYGEKGGMRTLNQSLLQLLMRRKIELKQAFEMTTDPDGLDQLLQKVGI